MQCFRRREVTDFMSGLDGSVNREYVRRSILIFMSLPKMYSKSYAFLLLLPKELGKEPYGVLQFPTWGIE